MKIYAFDVDETLEVSVGPIKLVELEKLHADGHMVGLCGNWAAVMGNHSRWARQFISFIGPIGLSKDAFLRQLQGYIRADSYIMVGNILGVSGGSDDKGAADAAGWRFIKESDFAAGVR